LGPKVAFGSLLNTLLSFEVLIPCDALGRRVTYPYELRIGEVSRSATGRFWVEDA